MFCFTLFSEAVIWKRKNWFIYAIFVAISLFACELPFYLKNAWYKSVFFFRPQITSFFFLLLLYCLLIFIVQKWLWLGVKKVCLFRVFFLFLTLFNDGNKNSRRKRWKADGGKKGNLFEQPKWFLGSKLTSDSVTI